MTTRQFSLQLLERARQWAAADPDADTRAELNELIAATCECPDSPESKRAAAELEERFTGTLTFGTAGLRAPLGAGPMRMNRIVIRQATTGLIRYALKKLTDMHRTASHGNPAPIAIIGYDARHRSYDFAADSAVIFSTMGFTTYMMPRAMPTPLTAYACRALNAEVAVMVTASHNPASDNGYKVYLGGSLTDESSRGAQIISPADQEIAAEIAAVDPLDPGSGSTKPETGGWIFLDDTLLDDYVHKVQDLAPRRPPEAKLHVVFTPTHGVGGAIALKTLENTSYVHPVVEQFDPDPDFPTVRFPNPEEPEAMESAFALAAELTRRKAAAQTTSVDCVIALDPDADRCALGTVTREALAAGRPATEPEDWVRLSGDEVGALLAQHVIKKLDSGPHPYGGMPPYAMSNSLVSSPLLEHLALSHGIKFFPTLSGSKWFSRIPGLVYGFEESLGYCVDPRNVRDKDGISSALLVTDLIADLKEAGQTAWDALDELALRYGLYSTSQLSLRMNKDSERDSIFSRVVDDPLRELLNSRIIECANLEDGYRGLPAAQGMVFVAEDGNRCIVRPSGTEPKLKFYFLVVSHPATPKELEEARQHSQEKLVSMREQIFRYVENLKSQ